MEGAASQALRRSQGEDKSDMAVKAFVSSWTKG